MDFALSTKAADYRQRVELFINQEILPVEAEYLEAVNSLPPWQPDSPWPTLPIMRELRAKAKAAGLWNLFLPEESGLSTLEYATVAELMGRSLMAAEVFNCNAPDTGNMEVLHHFGDQAQQDQWLKPLLNGEIHSAFCMTEPEVASSDATNMQASAIIDGDKVVINGRKWWSTGIGHADCELLLVMAKTFDDAPKHQQHSIILVPRSTSGVKVRRMLTVFGDLDAPLGHGEVEFDNVVVDKGAIVAGPGQGFAIAQGRLGPGRIHHCMRCIGAAERTLELLLDRANSREAFKQPLARLGGNPDVIADARISIEQARLLTLKTAWKIDQFGIKNALSEVSQIKVAVPNMLQKIVDDAIQIYGGAGVSEDFPLTGFYRMARALRIADGPDEVHRQQVAKFEYKAWKERQNSG